MLIHRKKRTVTPITDVQAIHLRAPFTGGGTARGVKVETLYSLGYVLEVTVRVQ